MFGAIQQKLRMMCSAQEGFRQMDKGVGFITVKDLIAHMPALFGISLKREEFLKLFKEMDSDKDGLVKYREWEDFHQKDYELSLKNIEKEKEKMSIQYEVFDHLMKVLQQKSLSLAEVFHQIDTNQNGFIECDEFQNLLERLGFTVSEA
jgi:Ca2+-binding EF-hand superfamily protein